MLNMYKNTVLCGTVQLKKPNCKNLSFSPGNGAAVREILQSLPPVRSRQQVPQELHTQITIR